MTESESSNPDASRGIERNVRREHMGTFFEAVHAEAAATILSDRQQWPVGVQGVEGDIAEKVVRRKDFSGLDRETPIYTDLLSLSRQREQTARKLIKRTIDGENELGLSPVEQTVLSAHCDLGEHFDELYMQWRQKIHDEPIDTTERVEALQQQYVYAVGEATEDGTALVPYAAAFPEPIGAINERLSQLVADLEATEESSERDALINYYRSFQQAIMSEDIDQHEALFRTVDKNWMKINGRMQPIPMVETEVESHNRVIPDLSLAFLDDREEDLNGQMQDINAPLAAAIREVGSYPESAETQSQVGVYTSIGAGMRLDFDSAGQVLPDRYDLRVSEGVKMFLNLQGTRGFRENYRGLMQDKFGGTTIPDDLLVHTRVLFNSGHERAHSAFGRSTDSMEEIKADIATLMAIPDLGLDTAQEDAMITSLLGTDLFYLHAAKKGHPEYYSSGITGLRAMIDAGVIKQNDEGLSIDLSSEAKSALYRRAKEISREVNDVCVSQDDAIRERFLARYATEPHQENEPILTALAA